MAETLSDVLQRLFAQWADELELEISGSQMVIAEEQRRLANMRRLQKQMRFHAQRTGDSLDAGNTRSE